MVNTVVQEQKYLKMDTEITFEKETGILRMGNKELFVHVFKPGQEVFDETLNKYHQFPGVATDVIFPSIQLNKSELTVFTTSGSYTGIPNAKCFNFHVCNKRFVFGVLPALKVPADVGEHFSIGAPITCNNKLVSVVTALHKQLDGSYLVPVTGVRETSLVSGHAHVRNGVRTERWLADRAIYGTMQLPYNQIKAYAMAQVAPPADALDSCVLFYNNSEVRITFNKGNFELHHWRVPGPMCGF
ncbi:P26 [Epiphyas postvittana nucleopolyhedrovirus]|uniref:p26 n=1 Tax=Epiphyas postvittana nucleopolyhedrovirus TaxID=70600 RepID=Q91GD6_NPVEP|nr:P26 [Epiphyas postvittana nucleopolyhedrovirus]AAK85683.1 P26 [Epiphyas postvittana nucleopolyhedrovirus]